MLLQDCTSTLVFLFVISSTLQSIWRVEDNTRLSLTTKLPPPLLEGWTEGSLALLTHFWRCLGLKGWQRQTVSLKYSNSHLHPEKGIPNYTSYYSVTLEQEQRVFMNKASGPGPTQKTQLWVLRDTWKSKLPPHETALSAAGCSHPGPWAQVQGALRSRTWCSPDKKKIHHSLFGLGWIQSKRRWKQ